MLQTDIDPRSDVHREIDNIVYCISHDLRASVRALGELPIWLREDLDDAGVNLEGGAAQTIDLMSSHARRLDEMLNGLLAYSRVGRLQEKVTMQPQDVFSNVLSQLDPGPEIQFFTQFNPVRIAMGSSDMAMIFSVLVSNVIRHVKVEEVRAEITSCRSGDMWELLVADNGEGIPDAEHERIFKPMVKLVSRDEDEGGGMGLAILRKICDHYDGSVHVEERKRKGGTTFRVRLPVLADP